MNPKLINGKWYIEVFTKELGYLLLLDNSDLLIPKEFSSKKEAIEHIKMISNTKTI